MARKRSKAAKNKGRNLASRMREPGAFKPRSVRKSTGHQANTGKKAR